MYVIVKQAINIVYSKFTIYNFYDSSTFFLFFGHAETLLILCRMILNGKCNNLYTLIKQFLERILQLMFLSYKQMKIAA